MNRFTGYAERIEELEVSLFDTKTTRTHSNHEDFIDSIIRFKQFNAFNIVIDMFLPAEYNTRSGRVEVVTKPIHPAIGISTNAYAAEFDTYKQLEAKILFPHFELIESKHKGYTISDGFHTFAFYNDYVQCLGNSTLSGNVRTLEDLGRLKGGKLILSSFGSELAGYNINKR
jgi:hypothetical protein